MEMTSTGLENIQIKTADPIHLTIVEKVRMDSETPGRLTHVEELGPLFPELTPEQIVAHLTELVKDEQFSDIRVTFSDSGAAFLYSDTFITPTEASEKIVAEEVQEKIASQVRQDSQVEIRLTPVESLVELAPKLEAAKVKGYATAMLGNVTYHDIRPLNGPTGIAYLYSETHMTRNYATILARIEAKDPYTTIAETVREESRVYPRPTRVGLFYEPLFQIESAQLEMIVEGLLRRPEYADIQKIVASTGAIYLYSNRYLEPAFAESWVEWEEVGRQNNP